MGKLMCVFGIHRFGEWMGDGAGMYKTCQRCGKLRAFKKQGPDGWEQAQRYKQGSS